MYIFYIIIYNIYLFSVCAQSCLILFDSLDCSIRASLIAQLVKNPPAMQKTQVRFLCREDLLEKGQATHSSILGLPVWLSR